LSFQKLVLKPILPPILKISINRARFIFHLILIKMNHLGFENKNFETDELKKFKSEWDRTAGKSTKILSHEDLYDLLVKIDSGLARIEAKISKENENRISEKKDKWLFNEDIMKILPVSSRTLQNYRDSGILPFGKLGNVCYYKKSDVEKMLEERYNKRKKIQ
jgi:hypothetical protein